MDNRTELDYAISNVYSEVRNILEKHEMVYQLQRQWKRTHVWQWLLSALKREYIPYDTELIYLKGEVTRLNATGGQMVMQREIERKLIELKRTG